MSIVHEVWRNEQELTVRGWIYGVNAEYVTDLEVTISSNNDLDEV